LRRCPVVTVDGHCGQPRLYAALRGDIEEAGGALAFHAPLLRAKAVSDGFEVEIGGDAPMALHCRMLINSGGLSAPAVARAIEGMPPDRIPTSYYAKGNYFSCATRAPFRA
jgi:L-2-hydroxyglutarate oxidase LhgO